MSALLLRVDDFFFRPASKRPLAWLRIGVALVLLAQAFLVRTEVMELFGRDGIVQGALANYLAEPFAPRLSWLTDRLSPRGFDEAAVVYGIGMAYVFSLCFLAVGLGTRLAAIVAWFLHWTLMNSGSATNYGADAFAHIFLFYLIWVPAGDTLSVDALVGLRSPTPSWQARLALRCLQLHLCIVYLASGLEKAMGPQWWNGELLWRALSLPVYHIFNMDWLANWPWLSKLGGWGTLLVELGYPIFIWPRTTRRLWVIATVAMHLGIGIFLGLGVFGGIMAVFTASLFGVSGEPEPAPASAVPAPASATGKGPRVASPSATLQVSPAS